MRVTRQFVLACAAMAAISLAAASAEAHHRPGIFRQLRQRRQVVVVQQPVVVRQQRQVVVVQQRQRPVLQFLRDAGFGFLLARELAR